MPPEVIADRYRVVREVGRGGMGAVYLCRDERLDREVAVKSVSGFPGESSPQMARALREARSSAALNHPHVVSIYNAVEEGNAIWLVMEYYPSRNLSQLIADGLPPERAAHIVAQAAEGLAAAHRKGMVHRDVKPSNILVGDDDQAKIADFGIAMTVGDDRLTQTGMVSGTPMYFSPQMAKGRDATPADDVWALGATLYAGVEGRGPWPQDLNGLALLTHIGSATEAPASTSPLGGLIAQMMAVEPEQRPSMAEVAERLRRYPQADVETLPSPAAEPTPRPTQVQPAGTADLPVAVTPEPAPVRRSRRPLALLLGGLLAVLVAVAVVLAVTQDDAPEQVGNEPTGAPESSDPPAESEEPAPPEETDDPEPPEPSEPAEPATGEETDFVAAYYGALPADTKTGWDLLSEEFQSEIGGYGSYKGFWKTIDAVTVEDATLVEPGVVDVTLTYSSDNGSETETRRLYLEETPEGYLVTGDDVV